MGQFKITEVQIDQMLNPMGLDDRTPAFSWILESVEYHWLQAAWQVIVKNSGDGGICWDSGRRESECSVGIRYAGDALEAETRYYVTVRVWSQCGDMQEAQTWFETGMLNPSQDAWEGAQWVGAPEYSVAADTIGAFVLEGTFRIKEGVRAGIVFGANDPRLLDKYKNESFLEGENYIRYVLNISGARGALEIYRVGYAADDSPKYPLCIIPAVDLDTGEPVITIQNRNEPHRLTVEVTGNCACAYIDGKRVDGTKDNPRQLNPLGACDVTTFPRLCHIGYYVGAQSRAEFEGISVRHLRTPSREFYKLTGRTFSGECQELTDPSCHGLPMLRRDFTVRGRVASARLYATARGIYECRINGKPVSEDYFAPGASQFDKHLMYQTYDVSGLLKEGVNGLGCILASGWWSDSLTFRLHNYNYWGDKNAFLGKLVICYEDGRRDVIVSNDTDWLYYGEGPYLFAGFFNGEHYDARKASLYEDFSRAGFTVDGCQKPQVIVPDVIPETEGIFPGAPVWPALNETKPALTGSYQAPVRAVETFTAKAMSEPYPGIYIYDLGQEIAGVPILRFHEKRGRKITVRYGEMLYPLLRRYGKLAGMLLQANLREASNTDIYICSGRDGEVFRPKFTFRAYRYIEISGVENPPALEEVQGVLLSSVRNITGTFCCDNELLNRFVSNVKYSQYCNFISIPTDCPQRNERMGWLGDTHIFCHTACCQSDVKNFYLRNLQAMEDMQNADGRFPSIAPFGGGFGGLTYESAMPIIVYELYQQYGDIRVIEDYYSPMTRWIGAVKALGLPGTSILHHSGWLGDWLAPEPCDDYLIWNAFHYRNLKYMQFFAETLGRTEEVKAYQRDAEETKRFWNECFVEPESGRTRGADGSICDVQGSYSIGLSCDVFDEQYRELAFEHLARTTEEGGCTVQSGFFGTGPINPMLSLGGYSALAYRTMTQTSCPSWLYPVTQGATTVWERWNSYTLEDGFGENNSMNSFNHYSLGSVVSWLYENVLGIKRDEDNPGYKHFFLQPEIHMFKFAKGGIHTPYGRIESEWERNEDGIFYRCIIPANTTADVRIGDLEKTLGSGTYSMVIQL